MMTIARTTTTTTTTVTTPVVGRRATTARGANAIARANAKDKVCAAALAMTVALSPLAANAAVEVAQVAKGDAKSLAGDLFAEQQAKSKAVAPKKTKQLAKAPAPSVSMPSMSAPSLPSFSAPSLSLPKLGGGEKKEAAAPKKKEAAAPKAKSSSGEGSGVPLPLVMIVLFSPLAAVQAFSFSTLARLAKQAADK